MSCSAGQKEKRKKKKKSHVTRQKNHLKRQKKKSRKLTQVVLWAVTQVVQRQPQEALERHSQATIGHNTDEKPGKDLIYPHRVSAEWEALKGSEQAASIRKTDEEAIGQCRRDKASFEWWWLNGSTQRARLIWTWCEIFRGFFCISIILADSFCCRFWDCSVPGRLVVNAYVWWAAGRLDYW